MLLDKVKTGVSLLGGWIDADPTVVGIVVVAVALCAIAFLVRRLRGHTGSG